MVKFTVNPLLFVVKMISDDHVSHCGIKTIFLEIGCTKVGEQLKGLTVEMIGDVHGDLQGGLDLIVSL